MGTASLLFSERTLALGNGSRSQLCWAPQPGGCLSSPTQGKAFTPVPGEMPQLHTQGLMGKYRTLIYTLQVSIQPATQHSVIVANSEITALFESVTVAVSPWILIQHLIHNCL